MKIQILSDLHNEFLRSTKPNTSHLWTGEIPETDSDLIILAGDIDLGTKGAEWAIEESIRLNKIILYVLGNHEFYKHEYFSLRKKIRELCHGTNVHLLDCDTYEKSGIRFIGTTLWTDYKLITDSHLPYIMQTIENSLADHTKIRIKHNNNYQKFKSIDALKIHERELSWLKKHLATEFNGKTVVITHHGPHPVCQHPEFPIGEISAAFYSDLSQTIKAHDIDLWVFGHTHGNVDHKSDDTRIVSNQAGYPGEKVKSFRHNLVIDI